jgi:hypothetical protein
MWDMFFKERSESKELLLLRYLNLRMSLTANDLNHYLYLEKGFLGEKKFDVMLEKLSNEWLILNDLLLEFNNTYFQIDTLLISHDTFYVIDIKNSEGDHYIDGDLWYKIPQNEIKNPLEQLKRCESLFRRYLQKLGFASKIESCLVFVNPNFYLYQAQIDLPIIFPCQINRFLEKLNKKQVKLHDRNLKLAEHLAVSHIKVSPFTQVPDYRFEHLKKLIMCKQCLSTDCVIGERSINCLKCGIKEAIDATVLRHVGEYNLLFPDRKMTTNNIFEWCGGAISKRTIRRLLEKHFTQKGYGKYTYYVYVE